MLAIVSPSLLMRINTAGSLHPSPLPVKTIKVVSKKENILASKMHQEFASAGAQIPHCLPVSLCLARRLVLE